MENVGHTSRNIRYGLVNVRTGEVQQWVSVPSEMFEDQVLPDGMRIVMPQDGLTPRCPVRLDMRKVRQPITVVATIESVLAPTWAEDVLPAEAILEIARCNAVATLDHRFAARMAEIAGPLAAIHAEKRQQAEVGGGALIVDESDRLAILANAAAQDEAVAAIERQRRDVKARLRSAATEDEIAAILAEI